MEILRDFEDERLDYWVTGFGTGGTLNGVANVLKDKRPETKIVCCEPDNAQLLGSEAPQPEAPATGERYLTTPLFEGIDTEMNAEESEIARLHQTISLIVQHSNEAAGNRLQR